MIKLMQVFGWLVVTAICVSTAAASGPRILSSKASAQAVGKFSRFSLDLQIDGTWKNPFDPNEANIAVEITSPSGRKTSIPAFYTQDYSHGIQDPKDSRRSVGYVKFYTEELGWHGASDIEFFLDDVALFNSKTGSRKDVDDMESGDVRRWGGDGVSWSSDVFHGGTKSLRFSPKITNTEHWPGPVTDIKGADWSEYDGLEVWVYPRYKGTPGTFSAYFSDTKSGNSPIYTLSVGQPNLKPNCWNHMIWKWNNFPSNLHFEKQGKPHWQARFTPSEVGKYSYRVVARDASGISIGGGGSFVCKPTSNPGFVRISKKDPRYFVRDDGKPFFPIGHDVSWDLKWAQTAFPKMAAHGENSTYCILVPWENSIEWSELGRYDMERAAKVDALIELAAANSIYLKLSFDVHDALRRGAAWEKNPYSAERGGPCKSPNEFYSNPRAAELYKRRLHYMLARWGYSPNIMAWETVAEINGGTEMPDGSAGWLYTSQPGGEAVSKMLATWLSSVHKYLRSEDPYGRLLTASFGGDVTDSRIWKLPEVQYVQLHHYDSLNPGQTMPAWCERLIHFGKPLMITESGWWADWTKPINDPNGQCQHDGMWASVMGGASSTAFSWWWEQIDGLNLYRHYQALHQFVDGIDWPNEGFTPISSTYRLPKPDRYGPVSLSPKAPFDGGAVKRCVVRSDSSVNSPQDIPGFLLAPQRQKGPGPTFVVDWPVAGEFRVHVDTVSPDARLQIVLDGNVALSQELPVENVPGKVSKFDEKWKIWSCRYDEEFVIPMPKGHHEITVENSKPGGSWINVTAYTLTKLAPPAINVVGLTGNTQTLIWVQNLESTWWNVQLGKTPSPISGAIVTLAGLKSGRYYVEWWDTYTGRVMQRFTVSVVGGRLNLSLPTFSRDIACKLRRL